MPSVTCDNYANLIHSIIASTKNTPVPGPQHFISQKYLRTSRITCKSCIHTDSTSSDSAAILNLCHVHIPCAILLLFLFHHRHFLTVLVPFCCYLFVFIPSITDINFSSSLYLLHFIEEELGLVISQLILNAVLIFLPYSHTSDVETVSGT